MDSIYDKYPLKLAILLIFMNSHIVVVLYLYQTYMIRLIVECIVRCFNMYHSTVLFIMNPEQK
jgi:hypothetical protein